MQVQLPEAAIDVHLAEVDGHLRRVPRGNGGIGAIERLEGRVTVVGLVLKELVAANSPRVARWPR